MVLAKRKTRLLRFNRRADCNKYGYNVAGLLTTILRKNGSSTIAKTENTYDLLHRIETITQKNAADQAFASYSYTRKTDGKISAVDEVTNGANRRVEYTYDALGRLTQEKRGILSYDIYQLDLVGNRTKLTKHTGSAPLITDYVYDARDRLQTETTGSNVTSYTYDANGSQVTKDAPGADIETYNWDARNRLSGATINRGGTTTNTSYKYDDSGIRSEVIENGVATKHLTDSMNPTGYAQVIEQTQGGVLLVSTVYGHEPIAQKDGSGVSLYLAEAHSGTRLLITVNAVILQQYVYDAFGKLLSGSGGNTANPILHRGERFDVNLQQYYNRARFYNPVSGRFGSQDDYVAPVGDLLNRNGYTYTANDPIINLDPSGRNLVQLAVRITINLAITALQITSIYKALNNLLNPIPLIDGRNVNAFDKQMAELSDDVYQRAPIGTPNWRPVRGQELGRLGLNERDFDNDSFGAQLYQNGGAYALAFRGTEDGADWWSNIAQGIFGPLLQTQYWDATTLATKVKQGLRRIGGGKLTMTGHSLGGGLAAAAGLETNNPLTTFNAAGLNIFSEWHFGGGAFTQKAINYSVDGEILSTLQYQTIFPTALGDSYRMLRDPRNADSDPITLHKMPAVLNSLGLR